MFMSRGHKFQVPLDIKALYSAVITSLQCWLFEACEMVVGSGGRMIV